MNRKKKYSHRSRRSSKNPQKLTASNESSPPPRNTQPPLRLLPPLLEEQWTAEEIWALMIHMERSDMMNTFSDTSEYWNSITPYFPGSSAENLRKMHLSIKGLERIVVPWNKDEVETLIASVYGYIKEPEDTPQWWGEIASNLPGRTALDCRVAYDTHVLCTWLSQLQLYEMRQLVVPSSTNDAVIASSERTSIEALKSKDREKEQQEETFDPSVPNSTMDVAATFMQRTSEAATNTLSKAKKKKKKKKKQQGETMETSVSSSTIDARCTSTNRTSEVPLMTLYKFGKEKQSSPSITLDVVGTSSERTSEATRKMTSKGKEMLEQHEETRQHIFANSTTFPGNSSTQTLENFSKTISKDNKMLQEQEETWQHLFANSTIFQTLEEFFNTTSNDKEKHSQHDEIRQRSFESRTAFPWGTSSHEIPEEIPSKDKEKHAFTGSTTYPEYTSSQKVIESSRTLLGGTSSQRSFVEPLKNWKLEDYFLLLRALTLNLHVDTDNAFAMEHIASRIGGKTGDEVRHIILKWRPHLLAALEKADRITGSSSGKKDLETSDSKKNDYAGNC